MQINSIINAQLLINSPLEQFEVTSLLGINAPIFGYMNLTLTNLALYSILVLFIVLNLHYAGNNDNKLLSSRWSILLLILMFGFMFLFLSNSN
jgi:F-type H+-transporting ATPase subunit a